MNGYSYLREVEELRSAPSSGNWATHLRRLQKGILDEYVRDRGGSFEDYVAIILAESIDPYAARTAFTEALKCAVQSWIPSALDRPAEVAMFVDLIAAFMPQEGYVKLFSKLRDPEQMAAIRAIEEPLDLAHGRDLRRKILNVLDSYFPTAQPRRDQAYRDFVRQLELHLFVEGYIGHAARLLLRRGKIALGDKRMQEVIQRDRSVIGSILLEIRSYRPALLVEKDARSLYEHALLAGDDALSLFGREVQKAGGVLDLSADEPSFSLPETGKLLLSLPDNVVSSATFLRRRWAKAEKEWESKESQIRAAAEREGARGKN